MFFILVYAPFLLLLPVLLLVGLIFVVVPGGFIVVTVGLYYAFAGVTALVGLAASGRWQSRAPRARRERTRSEAASPSRRPSFAPRGAPIPVTVGALDAGRAPDSPDRARPV